MAHTEERGIDYVNTEGEVGRLSGKVQKQPDIHPTQQTWVDKRHPFYPVVVSDERRQRASYIATRRALSVFLVPHRFEGPNKSGLDLPRAKLGYGLRLNQPFVSELFGHVRGAAATYSWGAMSSADEASTKPPEDGVAQEIWIDATGKNETWRTFFERDVLEWITTSPGGLIVVDSEKRGEGTRPTLMFAPWSWVEDYGIGPSGLTYVKLAEVEDNRDPKKIEDESYTRHHLLYELNEAGETIVSRWNDKAEPVSFGRGTDGEAINEINMGKFVDVQDEPRLPLVVAGFGKHPLVPMAGSGLLQGLDDIVIDLYNLMSEVREGYRDVSFGITVHTGPSGETVQRKLEKGTRFLSLGDHKDAKLERVAAESAEVSAGLALVAQGLESWTMSARRKVADAMERATQSGVSIKAEFQLDSRPLLIELTERLDEIESETMRVVAQIAESTSTSEQLMEIGVERETTFNLEDEADRVLRIAEKAMAVFDLPAVLITRLAMRWIESASVVDLSAEVEGPVIEGEEGTKRELRELIEEGFETLANSSDRQQVQAGQFSLPNLDL